LAPTATAYDRASPYPIRISLDASGNAVPSLDWDVPFRGTVIGTLLNARPLLEALGQAVHEAPYKAPPNAPILYVKPANTVIADGAAIPLPPDIDEVEIGATLGIVIGRHASRVLAADALDFVQGYIVVNDVTAPHSNVYRPAIRQRCRDGFCPVGRWVVDRDQVSNPDALQVNVYVNGRLQAKCSTAGLVRNVATLIADVTEFMSLAPGDVLLVGTLANLNGPLPRARAGDHVAIEIPGVGMLANPVTREGAPQ
jgi:5-oxopent-3-ene-1,2,5-tricarboxylate decarboxylase/2-hydroxyhepta-2,4-diene-1,7-dioate isomerase